MQPLDWGLTILPLVIVLITGLYARTLVHSVADFLSGNRSAGRYLLCIARGELQAGAVVFVAAFEQISHAGFSLAWWGWLTAPILMVLGFFGFVSFRYRETRAMTLGQYFEIRYGKSFRLFMGLLGFFAGILNFGIIPCIGARCMVYFLGLPETVSLLAVTMPTYVVLMAVFLSVAVFAAMTGGLVTVMVINCLEGIMAQIFYLIIIFTLLWMFRWSQVTHVLLAQPPTKSFVNPFDAFGISDFNVSLVVMGLLANIYGTMSWQNSSGYNSAALTPHEGRMGGVLSGFRETGKAAVLALLGLSALTYLHHPDFAGQAAHVEAQVHQIADAQAREQMELPIALSNLLPTGVRGILCAILLMGIFGGDATHLHSWSSIFIQDFLVPLRKRPFAPRQHLLILRCAILGVALFAFIFGISFHQTQYVGMWWSVTQAVFIGGAGSAIIGGLYWKKGNTAGAWAGVLTGSSLAVSGIIAQTVWGSHHQAFPLNGVQVAFGSSLLAVIAYVTVSLWAHSQDFNLDRMLHRGQYAVINPREVETPPPVRRRVSWGRIIGFDENYTPGDKWIAGGMFVYGLMLMAIAMVGTVWNVIAPWPNTVWCSFWHVISIGIPVGFALVTSIWFTWGGLRDMRRLFQCLKTERVNAVDDGTVSDGQNLDDVSSGKVPGNVQLKGAATQPSATLARHSED